MTAALLIDPRWRDAARALITGCADLRDSDDAVTFLEAVCKGLGDELYPAFLRVLCEIGRHGDHAARAAVARTLVQALRTGRLPSGRRAAWGSNVWGGGAAGGRSLGPLEYLCAGMGDRDGPAPMAARDFDLGAQAVMTLVSANDEARLLYGEHLLARADDPVEGALPRGARAALRAMAEAWIGGASPAEASARFLAALPESRDMPWASMAPRAPSFGR
ncbi:MAG TPA: hypothetical protein VGQ91_02955 [Ideonella sp.]|nr:hypothetical protein [Ideonella sp.]